MGYTFYTSCGVLAGTRNSSMGLTLGIDPTTHHTISGKVCQSSYHILCYTSRGALAGTRNSSMGPPWRIDPMTHHITLTTELHVRSPCCFVTCLPVHWPQHWNGHVAVEFESIALTFVKWEYHEIFQRSLLRGEWVKVPWNIEWDP